MFAPKTVLVWIGIILLSCTFLMGQGSECPWGAEVDFSDPNLEERIRWSMGADPGSGYYSGPLCTSTVLELWDLVATSADIADLSGLEHCKFLYRASLGSNQIDDISPLAGLSILLYLFLADNQISDLSPLAGLSLYYLDLSGNQITDLSPLAGMSGLTYLVLGGNQINDITPLGGHELNELWLRDNQISDLGPLAGWLYVPYLLDLSNNQISDLSPLAGVPGLSWLYLNENQITDILPLVNNTGIDSGDRVRLQGNPLSTTSCTVYIPQLQSRGVLVWHDCE